MRTQLLRQVRRLGIIAAGFLVLSIGLILAALPMIPGGMFAILLGLTILSTELQWARRLKGRILATGRRLLPLLFELFERRSKDPGRPKGPLSAEGAEHSRHAKGMRGLPIVLIGIAMAAVLVTATLIVQTDVATAP